MDLQYTETDDHIRVINLTGQLDTQGVGQIETRFTGYCSGDSISVLVDLSEVDFLASIGIRLLLLNAKSVARRGGRMALLSPQKDVGEVLELTAIAPIIPICYDIDSARRAVQGDRAD